MKFLHPASIGIGIGILTLGGILWGGAPTGYGPAWEQGRNPGQRGPLGGFGFATSEDLPEPIVTRQTVFVIPFRLLPAQDSSQQPVEVQLYVSTDQGRRWQLYQRVRPGEGSFLVRTTGEGEYWFLVRTVDRAGRIRPQTPAHPEMRVLVDTTPPKLEMSAEAHPSGSVTIRWKMTDRTLRPETLQITYRTSPDRPWQPIGLENGQVQAIPEGQEGQLFWFPPAGAALAELRAEVTDAGENLAVAHGQVQVSLSPAVAALNAPSNTLPQDQWRAPRRESPNGPILPDPFGAGSGSTPVTQGPRSAGNPLGEMAPSLAGADPVASSIYPPIQSQFSSPGVQDRGTSLGGSEPLGTRSPAALTSSNSPPTDAASPPATAASGDLGSRSRVPTESVGVSQQTQADSKEPSLPPGVSLRMVNSRVFELEYELGASSGVGRVELWATRDGGQTWQCWGPDADNRSPMIVSVPEEGVYGFRVMASSDPRAPPSGPAPGEKPDMWIGADWTRPTGRITAVQTMSAAQPAQVVIRWEASDRYLADRPISLFYSPTGAGGSWTAIATALENTGQFTWTTPAHTPDRIYIRLEIRDRAGNLTVDQTREAVNVGQPAERAKIRDVRPVSPASKALAPGRLS